MSLQPDFQFSQSNLQDYVDCPRRFELRYLEQRAWPALQSMPVIEQERHMQQGHRFHQMVHQHIVGLVPEQLEPQEDTDLEQWWHSYLAAGPLDDLPAARYPEFTLSAYFAGFRWIAKYDVIAIDPGERAVIVDWKTSRRRTASAWLKSRVQTRLYRFLLFEAGAHLNGEQPLRPEQIEMVYWFPGFPNEPEHLPYSGEQYEADSRFLERLAKEIDGRAPGSFMMTSKEKTCEFCVYRSLCCRGVQAGDWEEQEDAPEEFPVTLDIDLDQIGEIEF